MSKKARRVRGKSAKERRRDRLMEEILDFREFLKGSLLETKTRCGKPNCRCAKGDRHTVLHLSYKQGGKTKRVYIRRELAPEVRKWIRNRKKIQSRLDKAFELNVDLVREKKVDR